MPRDGGWILPTDPNAPTVCLTFNIPNDRNAIAAALGAMWEMSKPHNWQQGNPQAAIDFARRMELLLLDDFAQDKTDEECMDCNSAFACISPYLRTFPNATYRVQDDMPQFSLDGGTTWTDMPPDSGEPSYPPLTATPGATEDERLCLAATRAMRTYNALYRQSAGAVAAGLANTLSAIDNILYQINLMIADFVWGHATAVIRALDWDNADLPTDFAAPDLTSQQQEDLTCLLLENASEANGIVTFDYQAVFDNLIATFGVNPGTALTLLFGYIGAEGLNRAGNVENTDTGACTGCDEAFCYEWNLAAENGEFVVQSGPATWVSGQGWNGGFLDVNSREHLDIGKFFTAVRLTRVEIQYNKTAGGGANNTARLRLRHGGVLVAESTSNPIGAGIIKDVSYDGLVDEIEVQINSGTSPATITVYRLRVEGIAEANPFGEDNC